MAECDCELDPQGEDTSPGRVNGGEVLGRLVFVPEHVNDDGTLKNAAIPTSELTRQVDGARPTRGWSLGRTDHVDDTYFPNRAAQMQRGMAVRDQAFVFECVANEVRDITALDGKLGLCVVDVALPDDPAHAEVWGAAAGRPRATLMDLRDRIVEKLTRRGRVL